jgi:hypothetical protein
MQICVKVASCPNVGFAGWRSTLRTLTSPAVLLLLLLPQGAKYVIRTDVLYLNPPKQPAEGRGKSSGKPGLGRK